MTWLLRSTVLRRISRRTPPKARSGFTTGWATAGATAKHKVATPVDWKQGDDVIILTSVSDEDAKKQYPGGFKTIRPYLRTVAQPK